MNLAYLAIINGRHDCGKGTDINQHGYLLPWKGLDNSKFVFFFFNLGTSFFVCPENEMNDSYDSCHCSQLGMFLKKIVYGKSG